MTPRDRFLKVFPKAIADETASVFVGAGVSIGAGYPSWKALLHEIAEELGVSSSDVSDLAALAQWSRRTDVLQVIRKEIADLKPVPLPLEILARLPIRHFWTTNYDRLIERAFEAISRPIEPISCARDLAIRVRPGAARLFKMHGTIEQLSDLVISTDDYELYGNSRGAFLPMLQAHLTTMSMLFIGLSFTDPNVRHVLSFIRKNFTSNPPEHFAIVCRPHRSEFDSVSEFNSKQIQHKLWSADLIRYGLKVIEIDTYDEVPKLLQNVERLVAASRVWVSGSWPAEDQNTQKISTVAYAVGKALADADFALVTGSGLTVIPNTVGGFLQTLQRKGTWDLQRRLLVRPFPQPVNGGEPDRAQWSALRAEMARISGAIVLIGGAKNQDGQIIDADGVEEELNAAKSVGAFLLPIGSTGGTAKSVCERLIGSDLVSDGNQAVRPNDAELKMLMNTDDPSEITSLVIKLLKKSRNGIERL